MRVWSGSWGTHTGRRWSVLKVCSLQLLSSSLLPLIPVFVVVRQNCFRFCSIGHAKNTLRKYFLHARSQAKAFKQTCFRDSSSLFCGKNGNQLCFCYHQPFLSGGNISRLCLSVCFSYSPRSESPPLICSFWWKSPPTSLPPPPPHPYLSLYLRFGSKGRGFESRPEHKTNL